MDWKLLKQNRCPRCSSPLIANERHVHCNEEQSVGSCHFKCSLIKYNLYISGKKFNMEPYDCHQDIEENLEALNNL